MGGILLNMPVFALQPAGAGGKDAAYFVLALVIGLGLAFVFNSPKDKKAVRDLVFVSFGGLILYALALGAVETWGNTPLRRFCSVPRTQAAIMGAFVAIGSFIWGLVKETAEDSRGMNVLEFITWIKSGGKKLPRRLKQK